MNLYATAAFLSAGIAVTAVSARAADLPKPAPAPYFSAVPVASWSGLYAGSFLAGTAASISTTQKTSASGIGFDVGTGAIVGYAFQTGHWVYGLEGDVGATAARKAFPAKAGFVASEVDSIYATHARARVGYDIGAFLPFVAGGASWRRITAYQSAPKDDLGSARTVAGWTIGAGVDAKIMLPILGPSTLRAEYIYEGGAKADYTLGGVKARAGLDANIFRLGLITPVGETWRAPAGNVDWSGSYVGALGSASRDRVTTNGLGASTSFSATGGGGGVYSGKNWMFGSTMVGFEGDTELQSVSGSGRQPGAASTKWRDYLAGDLRGRVGYAYDRFLPFVAAGVAFDENEQSNVIKGTYRGATPTFLGTLGVGVDYLANERIALRAEYLHAQSLTSTTKLDGDGCCKQSQSGDELRFGVAYFLH